MQKRLTVKELKDALKDVPDELEVHFSSDTEEAYEIVIEEARKVGYVIPSNQERIEYFDIYGNAVDDAEEELDFIRGNH